MSMSSTISFYSCFQDTCLRCRKQFTRFWHQLLLTMSAFLTTTPLSVSLLYVPIASDGTVTCCVTVHRLTSEAIVPDSFHAPPWKNYAALSYTWGAPDAPKKLINMNGRPVKNGRIGRTSYTRDLFTAARTSTTGWTPYASTKRTSLRRMRRSHL